MPRGARLQRLYTVVLVVVALFFIGIYRTHKPDKPLAHLAHLEPVTPCGHEECTDTLELHFDHVVSLGYHIQLDADLVKLKGVCGEGPHNGPPAVGKFVPWDPARAHDARRLGLQCTRTGLFLNAAPAKIKLTMYSPQEQPVPWMITMPRSRMTYIQSSPNGVACPRRCQSGRLTLSVTPQMDEHLNQRRHTPLRDACPRHPPEPRAAVEWTTDMPKAFLMSQHSIFAPTDSQPLYNHMAMLAKLPNGTLVSAWQTSAVGEGESDMHIRLSLSHDPRGHSWAPSVEAPAATTQLGPRWSPVLHVDSTGRLWLFYSQSISSVCHAPGGDIWVVTYAEGEGWDTPRLLLGASHQGLINKVLANKMIVTRAGEWMLPYWREKGECETEAKEYAAVLVSADHGATWKTRGMIFQQKTWLIENSLVETRGALIMYFRSTRNHIYYSTSRDNGVSWTTALPLSLPNPDAKTAALQLVTHDGRCADGPLIMAFNDHSLALCDRCRTKLKLAVSTDSGDTWRRLIQIESEQITGLRHHYPTLLQVDGHKPGAYRVLVAYSTFFVTPAHREVAQQSGMAKHVQEGIHMAIIDIAFNKTVQAAYEERNEDKTASSAKQQGAAAGDAHHPHHSLPPPSHYSYSTPSLSHHGMHIKPTSSLPHRVQSARAHMGSMHKRLEAMNTAASSRIE